MKINLTFIKAISEHDGLIERFKSKNMEGIIALQNKASCLANCNATYLMRQVPQEHDINIALNGPFLGLQVPPRTAIYGNVDITLYRHLPHSWTLSSPPDLTSTRLIILL